MTKKTSKVPQYLLDDAWQGSEGEENGSPPRGARIVCTQPRRISAISVAERVAQERGEGRCGRSVGYAVRLESVGSENTSLMFCTNGVLLRQITHGAGLEGVTHVVCDEIHERDRFADFLLILLRELLPRHPTVRVVLMSATLHVDLFSAYFGGCPVVRVPGRTHPVTNLYLEDALSLVGYSEHVREAKKRRGGSGGGGGAGGGGGGGNGGTNGGAASPSSSSHRSADSLAALERLRSTPAGLEVQAAIFDAFVNGSDDAFFRLLDLTGAAVADDGAAAGGGAGGLIDVSHAETGATALMAAAGKGRLDDVAALLCNGADPRLASRDGSTAAGWARRFGHSDVAEYLDTAGELAFFSSLSLPLPSLFSKFPRFRSTGIKRLRSLGRERERAGRGGVFSILFLAFEKKPKNSPPKK